LRAVVKNEKRKKRGERMSEQIRSFKHPNMNNFKCPICSTSKDLPVVLIPVKKVDDNLCEAVQVHAECYRLYCKMNNIDIEVNE
jgi:hypothetical protein